MSSGLYTYYRVSEITAVSLIMDALSQYYQTDSKLDCLRVCNMDSSCAAVWLARPGWGELPVPDANTNDFIERCFMITALGVPQHIPQTNEMLLTLSLVQANPEFLA